MRIQFIKLNTGVDAALIVNGHLIKSVDTNFAEDGSIENLEAAAENLAVATECGMELIENYPAPQNTEWSWMDVLEMMQQAEQQLMADIKG